jgi:hypothetical protein
MKSLSTVVNTQWYLRSWLRQESCREGGDMWWGSAILWMVQIAMYIAVQLGTKTGFFGFYNEVSTWDQKRTCNVWVDKFTLSIWNQRAQSPTYLDAGQEFRTESFFTLVFVSRSSASRLNNIDHEYTLNLIIEFSFRRQYLRHFLHQLDVSPENLPRLNYPLLSHSLEISLLVNTNSTCVDQKMNTAIASNAWKKEQRLHGEITI